jgi:hypothetical protein
MSKGESVVDVAVVAADGGEVVVDGAIISFSEEDEDEVALDVGD